MAAGGPAVLDTLGPQDDSRRMGRGARIRSVALLAAAGAAAAFPAGSEATFPGRNGVIAYAGLENEVHTFRMDGTGDRRILGWVGGRPQRIGFTPDGTRLVYERVAPGRTGWVTVDVRTRRWRFLPVFGTFGSFSPDGRQIVSDTAHWRYPEDGEPPGIWRAASHGYAHTRLATGLQPRWSPDGRTIAYLSPSAAGPARERGLLLMRARTGALIRQVASVPDGTDFGAFDWSPAARAVAFSRADGVWTVPVDGSAAPERVAVTTRVPPRSVAWSPDGRWIAYVREIERGETPWDEVYVVASGGGTPRLACRFAGDVDDGPPYGGIAWQPLPRR